MVSIPPAAQIKPIEWDLARSTGFFDGSVDEFGGSLWVQMDVKAGNAYSLFANGIGEYGNDATFDVYNSSGQLVVSGTFGGVFTASLTPTGDGTLYVNLKMDSGYPGPIDFGVTTKVATNKVLSSGIDTYTGGSGERIFGWYGDDVLTIGNGTSASGGYGNDQITGNGAANQIWGDQGDDTLLGGGGDDIIWGGDGRDTIQANAAGNVQLYGGGGADVISAYAATTAYVDGGSGADLISGSAGIDILHGGADGDRIYGVGGSDLIYGDAGNDQIFGGDGNDNLYGGTGSDALDGGDGVDYAHYDDATTGVIANLGNAAGNTGDAAGDTYASIEGLYGSTFGDLLSGNSSDNILYGQDGDDNLVGQAGNDALYGGNGNDNLYGGTGADYLAGDNGFDAARYDTASAGVTAVLINSAMNTGDAAGDRYFSIEALVGSNYNDNLIGDNGNNLISGGAGNDAITGYAGNDTLYGGADGDVFFFQANSGSDMIMDFTATSAVHDTLFLASNLNGSGITDFNSAMAHATNSGTNVVFDLGGGNNLSLQGVQKSQLSASDFAFG